MRRHRDFKPMAEINITNLLDVILVLLIAFMIVAPALNNGLQIQLPKVKESTALTPKKPVMVSIKKRDSPEDAPYFTLDGIRTDPANLKKQLKEKLASQPDLNVIVQCDEREQSGVLLRVIGAIQGAGIENVGLETEPAE